MYNMFCTVVNVQFMLQTIRGNSYKMQYKNCMCFFTHDRNLLNLQKYYIKVSTLRKQKFLKLNSVYKKC